MQESVIFLAFILILEYNIIYTVFVGVKMKDVIKKSLRVFFLLFIANIMSFFLVISFNVITTVAFTEEIGYTAFGTMNTDDKPVELYKHYYKDGEDTKLKEYEDKGYTITTPSIRSVPSKTEDIASKTIAGVICIAIAICVIYTEMWKFGDKERTAVKYKNQKEQLGKGFIVGAFASIPAVVLLVVLTILKSSYAKTFPLLIYGMLNTYLYDLIYLIANGTEFFGQFNFVQILLILLLLTIIPIACGISYILGYKGVSISEKMVYKNKKI